jgi:serine/threonine protein kinase
MTFVDAGSRYELGSRIATGGMGEVWRATDAVLGREVAIKLLKAEYADDPTFRARFAEEARHAAALHHPNVAAIFDFGEAPGGHGGSPRPFLVMELVEGQPLSTLIRPGVAMAPEIAAGLLAQTADGVAVAHAAGIVHRDLKPANLLVTPEGQVKITDFGIARAADGVALTQTGQILGTPHYLSPEQVDGRSATPASDVYALGVVLFECLTGTRPFSGDSPVATALSHQRQPVPELPESVPEALRRVVRKALAKDPTERYADAAALAAALREPEPTVAMTLPTVVAAAPPPPTQVLDDRPRRRPPWWSIPVGLAIVVVAFLVLNSLGTDERSPDPGNGEPTSGSTAGQAITLQRDDYVGKQLLVVTSTLRSLGLTVDPKRVTNPGDETVRTVSDVSPLTGLRAGDTVVVSYWGPPQTPSSTHTPHKHRGKSKGHQR